MILYLLSHMNNRFTLAADKKKKRFTLVLTQNNVYKYL